MNRLRTLGIVAATAVATTALTGFAVAQATDDTGSNDTGSNSSSRDHRPGPPRGPGGGPIGGPLGDLLLQVQSGEVTAASATSVTLVSSDGFTATYSLDADTRLGPPGRDAEAPEVGDNVHVVADADTLVAEAVMTPPPAGERPEGHHPGHGPDTAEPSAA
jgi:hypothetical protein